MTAKIDDDAGETFEKWLYKDIGVENIDRFSKSELAELAYREAARLYSTRVIDMMKPFADPRMRRLAGVVAYDGHER